MSPDRFVYLEFGAKPTWHTGTFVPKDKVEEYATKYKRRDVYVSAFFYSKQENPSDDTPILGDLFFDIDSEDDVSKAQEDARTVIEIVNKELDIPEKCIKLYFTGKKGFRILVPWECFGLEPSNDLHEVWKLAAKHFHEAGCACIDLQVYQKNRFLRIPNTIHGDTGLFMIPLTADELRGLGVEQIRELARRPRHIDFAAPSLSEKAKEFYETVRKSLVTTDDAKPETADMTEIENLRKACPAVDDCYLKIERGEPLTHEQHVFISKVLLAFGKEGEEEVHRVLKLSMGDDYDQRLTQYQINYSKSGKWPPGCEFARKSWGICVKCDGSASPIERMRDLPMRVSVSDLRAELVGRRVVMDVQITGEQTQKAIPRVIEVHCPKCEREMRIDLCSSGDVETIAGLIFKDIDSVRERAEILFEDERGADCIRSRSHKARVELSENMDFSILYVRDTIDRSRKFDLRRYVSRVVYLIRKTPPYVKAVTISGRVIVEPKTRDISILAEDIAPKDDEIDTFRVTDEDRIAWPEHFGGDRDLTGQIAPRIVGRARELAKQAVLLLLHSPAVIPDIDGNRIRGGLRVVFIGDTKTGKSTIARDVTDQGDEGCSFGEYTCGETSSRAGITYVIDMDKKTIIWGSLVLNDKGLVAIDGLQSLHAEEMGQLREVLETQKIIVRRSQSGEAVARTRILACLNPQQPMCQYMYPCMSVRDTFVFKDQPNVTRWDLIFPFGDTDVSGDEIAESRQSKRPVPQDVFRRHVLWVWSRIPEQISYSEDARARIVEETKRIIESYALPSLPIVHNGARDILTRLAVAYAALTHSTDEGHEKVIAQAEHVEKAANYLREVLDSLELAEYKGEMRGRCNLEDDEFERIANELDTTDYRILDEIKVSAKSSSDLAQSLDVDPVTIRRHYNKLRRHELILVSKGSGVCLSPRGVIFLKRSSVKGCSVVTNVLQQGQGEGSGCNRNVTTLQGFENEGRKIEHFVETPLAMLMNAVRCLSGARDNGGCATIEALREISKTCGIEEERLEAYLRRMLERGLIMEIEEGKYKPTGG